MFYYAEINGDYLVINTHSLDTSSTNANYVAITEEQYTSGDVIGKYYNSLTGDFEILDELDCMGGSNNVSHKDSQRPLSTVIDNMQVEINSKADENHTHTDYASSDDLQELEDIVDTKANVIHNHTEYAPATHSHSEYALQTSVDALEMEIDGKANAVHSHTEYASSAHEHDEYAEVGHNHNTSYAPISHFHTDYVTTVDFNTLETEVDGKANENHVHDNYATVSDLNELSSVVSDKANASHSHNDIYYTETEINGKLATKADSSHNHTGVYDVSGAAASALSSAQTYTDEAIDALSETVDTKANTSDLASHTGNSTVHITSTERNNWNAAKTHANSAHAPSNAEENQNAFSNVVVGSTTISADNKTDTLTFVAGNNVTITPDATGDSITISSAHTVYTHPTSAGNKHIPAGGSSGQILRWSADGTAVWGNDNNTTYSNATQTTSGLMSDTDKTKLDGIAEGANRYVLPSAGTSLGGVKTGGDVTISSGVITVNDDSHNHVISNIDGLQSALDSKATSGHDHNSVYYTETEIDTLLSGKANSSHTHTISNITNLQSALDGKAASGHTHSNATASAAGLMSASDKSKLDGIASGANKYTLPTASSTLGGVKTTSTVTSNSGYTACPIINGVPYYKDTNTTYNLGSFGVTATAAELNYVDGVTSNIQTQLNGKAASSHTHNYAGSSSNGGAATSANKLATARTISLTGDVTGSTSFDGSGNVSITTTVADDSHNHTIANVDGLQSALDGKSATNHTHTAEALVAMAEALFGTNYQGGVEYSYGSGSGKNVLTEISNMPQGFHTVYAIAGTTGNPETAESYRYFIHKTSTTIGWIWAFGADGSIYSNYLAGANTYKGWKTIHDAKRKPLWTGSYYMTAGHTATPSKKLSQCEHGWMLLWSDYDPDTSTVNNTDFCTTMIPNRNWTGSTWNGAAYYCDIPRYTAGTATDSESRVIKVLNVYDNKLVGTANNNAAPRNDVILRAIYEF